MNHRPARNTPRCRWRRMALLAALCGAVVAQAEPTTTRGANHYRFDAADRLAPANRFAPWVALQRRLAAEPVSLEVCVTDEARCPPSYAGARRIVLRGRALSFRDRLELVNRFVNRRPYLEPIADQRWETLLSFLRRGGDCEDYAVAKYLLLRAIGLPADDLRIAVAHTPRGHGHHALLAVRAPDGSALLLDTDGRILAGARPSDYRFQYSVNETDLFDHALTPAVRAQLLADEHARAASGEPDAHPPSR